MLLLDRVLHVAPRAVDALVDGPGREGVGQRGNDEAGVGLAGQMLRLGDDPALAGPACEGGIGELGEPAGGPAPPLRFGLGVGQLPADRLDEPRVPGQADDVVNAVVLAPGQDLLAGIGGIGPKQNLQSRPPLPEPFDDAAQRPGHASGGIRRCPASAARRAGGRRR